MVSPGDSTDVIVIGAGLSGIYAAKFYLDVHPDCRLIILERDICVGGTWNSRRSYDSFWTQWTVGTAEFPDQAMPEPPAEDVYFDFFKAIHTTKYLEDYVDNHQWSGQTLRDRVQLSTEVTSVSRNESLWHVLCDNRQIGVKRQFYTRKLIISSGLTSTPYLPSFRGQFSGVFLHQENFGSSKVLSSKAQDVTVLGGGKSSADMVYSAVKAHKTVSWILKSSETTGPGFLLSPKGKRPYKNAFEIGMTRMAATFAPSLYCPQNFWTRFLHRSSYGNKLLRGFWDNVNQQVLMDANYENRDNIQGFQNLKPHLPIFWGNATGGLLNHVDFFEVIASNARIYYSDIDFVDGKSIMLTSGERIQADAILCGTGWLPSLGFFSEETRYRLGLPYSRGSETPEERSMWEELESIADSEVIETFPQLRNPPDHYHRYPDTTPCRLYKHIIPLPVAEDDGIHEASDRSIVFIGYANVGNFFPGVMAESMFATAYMDGKLQLPSLVEQRRDVAKFRAWCRRRYLSRGEVWNNMPFELMGYVDDLLGALGLRSHRRSFFWHWMAPNYSSDFRGLEQEYIEKFGRTEACC